MELVGKRELVLALLLTLSALPTKAQTDPVQLVNTQVGATGVGHVFAGASLPFGMVSGN